MSRLDSFDSDGAIGEAGGMGLALLVALALSLSWGGNGAAWAGEEADAQAETARPLLKLEPRGERSAITSRHRLVEHRPVGLCPLQGLLAPGHRR